MSPPHTVKIKRKFIGGYYYMLKSNVLYHNTRGYL